MGVSGWKTHISSGNDEYPSGLVWQIVLGESRGWDEEALARVWSVELVYSQIKGVSDSDRKDYSPDEIHRTIQPAQT